jgi:serine/threonine-protein kinase
MALGPGARLGPYEIQSAIGAGGMGEVYRATDTNLNRQVAIKVLPETFAHDTERLARFEREAKTLASLNHSNIAQIYGFEKTDGIRALVMELVEGPTLADRIAQGPIPVDEALAIAKQIAEGLEAAHEQGIIHRDLKPANIKLRADGTVKVLDFGLAKALGPPEGGHYVQDGRSVRLQPDLTASPTITSPAMMTGVGVLLGTAAYMSPEQSRGEAVDRRADIWAFGCVLYEMLTGKLCFDSATVADTLAFVLTKEPDWGALPPTTPPLIASLLRHCLEKDRRKRAGDIAVARVLIDEAGPVGTAPARSTAPIPVRPGPPWRWLAIYVAPILTAGLLVAGRFWWTTSPASPLIVRSEISTPPGSALSMQGNDRDLVLTPDGSRLIYRGINQLLVRALDQLDAKALTGLGAPRGVFTSPDGEWIGFFDGNTALKKVAITGGPAITIAHIDGAPRGATWTPEGIIYFSAGEPNGIQRVSAAGSDLTRLTQADRAKGEAGHFWPEMLPGGRALLFTIITSDRGVEDAQIAVLDLATGTHKVVVRGGTHAHFVPTGHLVYSTGGTLRAVPFDLRRMEVVGTPVSVGEGVVTSPAGSVDATVAGNGAFVYVRGRGIDAGATPRSIVWVDRLGREEPVTNVVRPFTSPRLSPLGQDALFQITDEGDDIWRLGLGRSALTRQTFERVEDETPEWSPDGKWIAWASTEKGFSTVFRRPADGSGGVEALWSAPNVETHTHVNGWTPDGRMLLLSRIGLPDRSRSDIALLKLDDGNRNATSLLRSAFNVRASRVSPDGRWIAYTSNESGRDEVYVHAFPSLEGKWQISTSGGTEPMWSRKGDELFYRGEGALMVVGISRAPSSFSASSPHKMFNDNYFADSGRTVYDVSADGQRFLMLKNDVADEGTGARGQIILVQNWFEELKRLVPTN